MSYDAIDFQENPALANWSGMGKARTSWERGAYVDPQVRYAPVKKSVDKKTGQVRLSGGPYVLAYDASGEPFHYRTKEGQRKKFGNISLFTFTSKMSCASFSIPAGPTNGGTCPASRPESIEKEGSYLDHHPPLSEARGGTFICDLCYAGKGNYQYPNISAGQMAKRAWVLAAMADGTFADRMAGAIELLLDKRIESILLANGLSNRFFRIHDSGDFFSRTYYEAWVDVCSRFKGKLNPDGGPLIYFWAPTRMWVYREYLELFREVPPPPNLSLRPSALFTGAPAPMIQGMAAGSTSAEDPGKVRAFNCPAYEAALASCAGTKCRRCWTLRKVPINYTTH